MTSNAIMQCSSSSSHPMRTYDMFVSFRGETRNNFTGFLFEALLRKGIDAFKDDKDLKKGESIAPELLQAIEGSRIFVVVFSKDYASSTWCLRELQHICKCIERLPRRVLPIFYDVDPSELRKQSQCYGKAFAEHEERFRQDKENMEEVQRWREALTRVANFSGWDIRNKSQHVEIEKIVQEITNILGPKFSSLPNDNLVGMESRVTNLEKLLHLELVNEIRVVGISGMGGIGKTTLGSAVYERISHQYDFRCYIDYVSKIYRDSSTIGVQKQLLSLALNDKNLEICNASEGTLLSWTRLRYARALIIFDNVDKIEQLEMFKGSRDTLLRECLGGGSRIIVISRDQHLLKTHGVDDIYQVQLLNHEDAIQLFCRKAFKSNDITSDYQHLTDEVLSYAQGHPLAIKTLGSSLFDRDILQWKSALVRLRENKSKSIMDVLRISYDVLEDSDQEIFLDIACFFCRQPKFYVKDILLYLRGFHTEYGLKILNDKSLITMNNDIIDMHGLLRDLGRHIVQEISPKEPRKWSRLWDWKDLRKVMSNNMAAKNVEAIVIEYQDYFHQTTMRVDVLSTMSHLKMLNLGKSLDSCSKVNFSGRLDNLSSELISLKWNQYPFESLPQNFEPDKLVELIMKNSNIKQLWEGTKSLPNLRYLNLSRCKNLIEMPDIGKALNLEKLNLSGCSQLRQISPSTGRLGKLVCVNLNNCSSLIKLPHFDESHNLARLNLEGCIQLRHIHPSLGLLKKLFYLNLKNCKNLVSLPKSLLGLNALRYLILSGCSKLYNIQFLAELRDGKYLKKIDIYEASVHSQSTSFYSREHKSSISCLLPSLPIFPCMRELDLSFCNLVQIPDAIGTLCCLERLDLSGNNFATLPNLEELSKLLCLDLNHCKQLKYLLGLPSQVDFQLQPFGQKVGSYFFNCPEIVERDQRTSMVLSWMIKFVQCTTKHPSILLFPFFSDGKPTLSSIVPGSEIPRWFKNQHVSKHISIGPSSIIHDNKCIGVMCCAIFVARRKRKERLCSISSIRKGCFYGYLSIPVQFDGDPEGPELILDDTDHMWLFFLPRKLLWYHYRFECHYHNCMTWNIETSHHSSFQVEVKKYGYRWVYEQDLEPSNLTMMQDGNPLDQKRKFLAIEQNDGSDQGKRSKGRVSPERRKVAAISSLENTIKLLQNQFANLTL